MILAQNRKHAEILESCKRDMLLFGKLALPNMFSVKTPPFHRLICNVLQGDARKINIVAPRGHAKSSMAACVWPLHHIFFSEGAKVVVLVSKTEGHAKRLLQTIKDALDYSIPLRQIVGYWGEHSARKWAESEVVLKDNTLIVCRGTGQQVVGLKHGNQRPTLIILDDPEDMNNTKTPEAMEYNLRWLLQALMPSVDPLRGKVCVIGTPQHQRCIVETLKNMEGWVNLRFKAIQDDGTALWPEWMPIARLLEEKSSLESINRVSAFYREFQCEVVGDEDQLFREEDLQYWEGTHHRKNGYNFLEITHLNNRKLPISRLVPVTIFTGVDPASSTSQTADYSAIVTVACDAQSNRYVLPYFRKRVTPMHLAEAILQRDRLYRPEKTRVESVGYQEMLREYLRTQAYIPGLELKNNPRTAKSHRLETLQPFFFQKKVFIMPQMQELRDELLIYPRGSHDDLLDGLYYAMKGNYMPTHDVQREEPSLAQLLGVDGNPEEDWTVA